MDTNEIFPQSEPQVLQSRGGLVQEILTAVDTFWIDNNTASTKKGSVPDLADNLIKPILHEWGKTKKFDQVSELAQQVVEECPLDTLLTLHHKFTFYQNSENDAERVFSRNIAIHTLKRFNIDPEIIEYWVNPDLDMNEYQRKCTAINHNLPNVIKLEQKYPGSATLLVNNFQLTNFSNSKDCKDYLLPWYEKISTHKDFGKNDSKDIWGELIVNTLKMDGFSEEDVVELMDVWHACARKGSFFINVAKNLEAIALVEAEAEARATEGNVTKTLFEQFGICNFLRYKPGQLAEQYLHRDDSGDFGLVVYPKADYNGACESNGEVLNNLHIQSDELGIPIRIFEVDSVSEMIVRVGWFIRDKDKNSDFKYSNKIAFMVLAGHGEPQSIQLGNSPYQKVEDLEVVELGMPKKSIFKRPKRHQLLLREDLKHGSVFRKWFVDNPSIVLISCSTGVIKGIGERLSGVLDAVVKAPDNPTNIQSIKVSKFGNSSPVLDPEYIKVSTNVFRSGTLRHHRN